MAEPMVIRSRVGDYAVRFADRAMEDLSNAAADPGVLIADRIVLDAFGAEGWAPERIIAIDANEDAKTLAASGEVLSRLVSLGFRRDHRLVVLGGGVVQDLASFCASILYRGVPWTFFPTTLLAQCDSCIGGKTSINHAGAKNILGNFYPPREIVIASEFLDTLPVDAVRSGIGEMLHYFIYADSPYLPRVAAQYAELAEDRSSLLPFVAESLQIKQRVIEVDEFERGERQKFNYGHTFGHAIEAATRYAIPHGLAVSVGMDLANFVSVELGLMERATFESLHAILRLNFPTYEWSSLDIDAYAKLLMKDKKNTSTAVRCILAEAPGRLLVRPMRLREDGLDSLVRRYFESELPHG